MSKPEPVRDLHVVQDVELEELRCDPAVRAAGPLLVLGLQSGGVRCSPTSTGVPSSFHSFSNVQIGRKVPEISLDGIPALVSHAFPVLEYMTTVLELSRW